MRIYESLIVYERRATFTVYSSSPLPSRSAPSSPHQLLDELARHNYFTPPDANGIILASCSCLEHRGPGWMCKHAAALCYVLIHTCEVHPLSYLNGLGLHLSSMLDGEGLQAEIEGASAACPILLD